MKKPLYTILLLALVVRLSGQAALIPDTLLIQNFEDPEFQDMLFTEPSGDDAFWVNYDEDGLQGDCVDDDLTPGGWYRESDLGDGPNTENFVFSSCSYLEDPDLPVKNWLITPPITLTDAGYVLRWKSMSYYGPSLLDGYRVLVSTASNFPADFTHLIFQAAEFLGTPNPDLAWTLQVSNHVFSPGWIHADSYTDTSAFFLDYEDGEPFYHGKLDAHSVSLAQFAGQTVYIAFLHKSTDDFILQIDDLVIDQLSGTRPPVLAGLSGFTLSPNPAADYTQVRWSGPPERAARIRIVDPAGRVAREELRDLGPAQGETLPLEGLPPGTYFMEILTNKGLATRRLLKL